MVLLLVNHIGNVAIHKLARGKRATLLMVSTCSTHLRFDDTPRDQFFEVELNAICSLLSSAHIAKRSGVRRHNRPDGGRIRDFELCAKTARMAGQRGSHSLLGLAQSDTN